MSFYKAFRIYKLTEPIVADIAASLTEHRFVPCAPGDKYRSGFIPAVPGGSDLIHTANGFLAFTFKQQEKILPGGAIKEMVEAKARTLSDAEDGRPIGRKERQVIRDEIIISMLPQAFTRSTITEAYIDLERGYIVVGTGSAPRAEALISQLRDALGSLRCIPLAIDNPVRNMTLWVKESTPPIGFALGEKVVLNHPKDHSNVVCKRKDLTSSEVLNHLASGMYVSSVALEWKERVSFVINEALAFTNVLFSFEVTDADNAAQQFDADFVIMTAEIRLLVDNLLSVVDKSVSK